MNNTQDKGITLIALIITIIVVLILATVSFFVLFGEDGIVTRAVNSKYIYEISKRNESIFIEEMNTRLDLQGQRTNNAIIADYIQPWLCSTWTKDDFDIYFGKLKKAGMEYCILQYSGKIEVIGNNIEITELYFNINNLNSYANNLTSKLNNNTSYSTYDVLYNILNSAKDNDIKLFIGLCDSQQWFEEKFIDEQWRQETTNTINLFAKYLISEYQASFPNTFCGIYYPLEFYTNNKGYEKLYWAEMLSNTIMEIQNNELDYLQNLSVMISTYSSQLKEYVLEGNEQEIKEQFKIGVQDLIKYNNKNTLRSYDIICTQDKIATNLEMSTTYSRVYLEAIREIIDEIYSSELDKVQYWINIENFNGIAQPSKKEVTSGDIKRIEAQIYISQQYADNLACFSYAHYWLNKENQKPLNEIDNKEKEYIDLAKKIENNKYSMYSSNKNITIHTFDDGTRVPIPNGFYYISGNLNNGIIISDAESDQNKLNHWELIGNQFIWIPIDNVSNELRRDNFRFDIVDLSYKAETGKYWEDMNSEYQSMIRSISLYGGFYVARYEASKDIQNNITYIAGQTVLNDVTYEEAYHYSKELYGNSVSVQSHLMYGIQWDSILNLFIGRAMLYNMNQKFTFINIRESQNWGNYGTQTNSGVQKYTGDAARLETEAYHIFDLAGNFWEITQEKYGLEAKPVLRGGSFREYGDFNPVSYRFIPQSYNDYKFLTSFRTALYIK